jgi:hypothetical protein
MKDKLIEKYNECKANKFVIIQGEIIGLNIQNNKYKREQYEFFPFNLFIDSTETNYIKGAFMITVPFLDKNYKLPATIQEAVEYAKGKSVLADIPREGLVLRNYEKNISFKIINTEFLLRYQDEDEKAQEEYKKENK